MLRSITEQYRSNRETSAGSLAASDQDASVGELFADSDSDEERMMLTKMMLHLLIAITHPMTADLNGLSAATMNR